jgi:hypothetical protein
MSRPRSRDPRRWIYAGLDLALAAVWAAALGFAVRSRFTEGRLVLDALPTLGLCAGVGTLAGGRWGWRVAAIATGGILAVTTWLLLALCVDAAYLAGVYGAFGKAAASMALVSALILIEVVALVPALQLKWLMTRAGRRAFDLPPRGRAAEPAAP